MNCKYNNRCGYIAFDIVFQRYLAKYLLNTISSNNEFRFIKSSWDNYIFDDGEEDQYLFNSEWKMKPSIICVEEEGTSAMTCCNYNHGTHLPMIHPCRTTFTILPALRSDQL